MRWIAFILSIQIISSGQALGEVVKLANLADHYRMHTLANERMTLMDFIRLHYFDPSHEASDPAKHQHLPLHLGTNLVNIIGCIRIESIALPEPVSTVLSSYHSLQHDIAPQGILIDIFQPPRSEA